MGNHPNLLRLALWALLLLVVIVVGLAVVGLSSLSDWRLERVFGLNYLEILRGSGTPLYTIAELLAFAERVMYWEVGLGVFSRYPILGVGLGGSGFFFREYVPAYAYHLPELIRRINGAPGFPNPKNLWIRLLAETGIVGFLVFSGWLLRLALGAIDLLKKEQGWRSMISLAGLLALIAQVFEGFSLDTFALPQLWIMLGFLAAALSPSSSGDKIPEER
ncbi:MAG: O-antigen ligase family protein [Anaerolineales bacterium]|nr:O-antigen ligase family protein [Anaerolineales bacterium]